MSVRLPGGRVFQFRPVLTLCVVIAMAILIWLGSWQLQRREWKLALIEKVETRLNADSISFDEVLKRAEAGEDMEYTPVKIAGVFDHQYETRVFGSYDGGAGVYVFTPLRRDDGVIYINRGFAPQAETGIECFCTPEATPLAVTGLFRSAERPSPPASWFQSDKQSVDGLWFVRDPAKFVAATGLETPEYYIDADASGAHEWPKGGTTKIEFRNNHLDYALTWFGLALSLLGVWLILSLKMS